MEEPIFIANSDPHHLIASVIGTLEHLASQSKAKMKNFFLDIQTTIKIKLGNIFEKLSQRHYRCEHARLDTNQDDCDNEIWASAQSYRYKKNQRIDPQESLELCGNVLPVFGFNSAKYDHNLIKSYLLHSLVNERDIEPTVIKKANHFISFNFGDNQLLDIKNFLCGATSLDWFLKAYKTSETTRISPTKDLINLIRCRIQNFPH